MIDITHYTIHHIPPFFFRLPEDIQILIYKILFQDALYSIKHSFGPFLIINTNKHHVFYPNLSEDKCSLFPSIRKSKIYKALK